MADRPVGRKRGRGGPARLAGAALRGEVARAAAKRGFAEPDVLIHWPEIVGADLAPHVRPVKVSYGRNAALGATLVVEADGARATEIAHLSQTILERVNCHYGYRAISRMKIVQTSPAGFAEDRAGFAGRPVETGPAPAATAEAERLAADIADPELRAALSRLGAHVLTAARRRPN